MSTKFATGRLARLRSRGEAGMAIAEYAVATVAVVALALAFAALMKNSVADMLVGVIAKALERLF